VLLALGWSCFPQAARSQSTIPYGPYGYSPGSYDDSYSTSNRSSGSSYSPASEYTTTIPYSRYGYTPGAYDYSYGTSSPRRSYTYAYPSYGYAYPSYAYSYPSNGYNLDSTPVIVGSTAMPAENYTYTEHRDGDNIGRVRVHLPANAKLWVDGEQTRQKGADRDFMTPPLRPDQELTYTFKAQWNQDGRNVERTRQVRVKANDSANVDFTAPQKVARTAPEK
jgi:uncharacterized protein (TIGR03000 family)